MERIGKAESLCQGSANDGPWAKIGLTTCLCKESVIGTWPHLFVYIVFKRQQLSWRPSGLQRLKYLLSGPSKNSLLIPALCGKIKLALHITPHIKNSKWLKQETAKDEIIKLIEGHAGRYLLSYGQGKVS